MTAAQTRASTPWTAMPTNRKGSNSSHTIGYRNSASRATGQHSTTRKHQSRKAIIGATPPEYNTQDEGKKFGRRVRRLESSPQGAQRNTGERAQGKAVACRSIQLSV